jgi:exodeoxyribonuclease VIII
MSAADTGVQNDDGVHVMIDIETMSTAPNAAILAIGAVTFTVDGGVDATTAREWLVDLGDSVAHGGQMDADTVLWWTQQSERARRGLVATRQLREHAALEGLAWMLSCLPGKPAIWANGTDFDLTILRSALCRHGMRDLWAFWQQRDLRTLRKLMTHVPAPVRAEDDKHGALRDAVHQAEHCVALLRELAKFNPTAAPGIGAAQDRSGT